MSAMNLSQEDLLVFSSIKTIKELIGDKINEDNWPSITYRFDRFIEIIISKKNGIVLTYIKKLRYNQLYLFTKNGYMMNVEKCQINKLFGEENDKEDYYKMTPYNSEFEEIEAGKFCKIFQDFYDHDFFN